MCMYVRAWEADTIDIVHWSKDDAWTGRWSIDTLLRKLSRLMSIDAWVKESEDEGSLMAPNLNKLRIVLGCNVVAN